MSVRSARRPRTVWVGRAVALTLLSLVAFFAFTVAFDRCDDEADCGSTPCHFLCMDGCTTTPVPNPYVDRAPLALVLVLARQSRPLDPPSPFLAPTDRPPRPVA